MRAHLASQLALEALRGEKGRGLGADHVVAVHIGADAILIATEWPEFRTPDFEKLSGTVKAKVIFDGRNVYELNVMKEQGYQYYSIGREVVHG